MKKICKHDSTFGPVGGEFHFCFDCKKDVKNPDMEEELEMLQRIKKEEKWDKAKSYILLTTVVTITAVLAFWMLFYSWGEKV